MRSLLPAILVCATAVALLASAASGEKTTTQPAEKVTLENVHQVAVRAETYARWGCVLSALALVGVLWVVRSAHVLARNQVDLARLVRPEGAEEAD